MNSNFMTKVKEFLVFLLIASILTCVSYIIVYKVSYLPNGYDIETMKKDTVSLKSFNLLGIEKNVITQTFSGDDTWQVDEIKYEVKRQKTSLWLLFSAVTISIFLFINSFRNGSKLWKAILESNLFTVLLPLYNFNNSLHMIHMMLGLTS